MSELPIIELLNSECAFCQNRNVNYLEKAFKFRTSALCGHQVCSNCFRGPVFQKKREVPCPKCNKPMNKAKLKDKSWDELQYEKEIRIRKEIYGIINLTREDFDNPQECEDALELAETLVAHRMAGTEEDGEKSQLEEFEARYRAKIQRRRAIRASERQQFLDNMEEEEALRREKLLELMEAEEEEKELRRLEREEGIKVELGERRRSKVAELRAKKKREEELKREQEAIQQGYGPQVMALKDNEVLWTQAQLEQQPKKIKGQKPSKYKDVDAKTLRTAQQKASGFSVQAREKRIREMMIAGLLSS